MGLVDKMRQITGQIESGRADTADRIDTKLLQDAWANGVYTTSDVMCRCTLPDYEPVKRSATRSNIETLLAKRVHGPFALAIRAGVLAACERSPLNVQGDLALGQVWLLIDMLLAYEAARGGAREPAEDAYAKAVQVWTKMYPILACMHVALTCYERARKHC